MPDTLTARLFYAPRSPFARKIIAALALSGLADRVQLVLTDPWTEEALRRLNPLCKVPTLALSTGLVLFDSRVIAAHLDGWSGGRLVPAGERRWEALRREALGDGLAEAVIRRYVETLGPAHDRSARVVARQDAAIAATLDELERGAAAWSGVAPDIGHLAIATAVLYLSDRSPELPWSEGRPLLAGWFCAFRRRPFMMVAEHPDSGEFRLDV